MRLLSLFCLISALSAQPFNIGGRRELFVDRTLIDRLTGAELRPADPLDAGTVLLMEKPREGAFSGYFTILKDGGLFRMYYRGVPTSGGDGRNAKVTSYAESPDGIPWTKPELGLHQSQGSRANNITLADAAPYSHNFCPMLDSRPGTPRMERFKALAGLNTTGLAAFRQREGLGGRTVRRKEEY